MQRLENGPDRIFPAATGLISTRRNLLLHLLRLAELRLGPGYKNTGPEDPFGQGDVFFDALQHIAEILDPDFQPSELTTLDTMRAALKRVEELWTEVVIGEADPVNAQKACDYAHKLLSRFPGATASYVNECANAFIEPQTALDLLAQASRFITTPEDAFRIDRAQKHSVQVIVRRKMSVPTETLPTAPALQTAISSAAPDEPFLTESHRDALGRLVEMGELFYDRPDTGLKISLRPFALIVAPTGAGKSFLARKAAASLRADYFKITRGDWCPRGTKTGRPTTFSILDRLLDEDRVMVHLDECDKLRLDVASEWSASLATDIWNTLDGHFPVKDYLRETKFEDGLKPAVREIEEKIRTKLWIVGSGTWQDVFAKGNQPTMGFGSTPGTAHVTAETIRRADKISPELLLRFNSDLIFLSYPSKGETAALLRSSGITALADELGVTITPDDVDWTKGGMRVLETLATRLMLQKHRRVKGEGLGRRP